MSQILSELRCRCKEEFLVTKMTKKPSLQSEGKPVKYPDWKECTSVSFVTKSKNSFSLNAKLLLNTFRKKYFYHAVEEILCSANLRQQERDNLLSILSSPAISLQNHFFIDFFEIWINDIYINETSKTNRFLKAKDSNFLSADTSYITIKLFYRTKPIIKNQEPLW